MTSDAETQYAETQDAILARHSAGTIKRYVFPAGTVLFQKGETRQCAFLIDKGKVKIIGNDEGGEDKLLCVLDEEEIFGELAVTDEKQRSHFAEATQDSLVCIFPRNKFQQFLAEHQELTFKVMKLIGFRLRDMETRLQDLTFQPVAERLQVALVRLAERHGAKEPNGKIRLSITQKDLAYLIGATRESVAEELGHLKRSGIIDTAYRSLLLNDMSQLRH